MPIDYKKYAPNWKTEIRPAILERAQDKCEFCGVENHSEGLRDNDGKFWTLDQIIYGEVDFVGNITNEPFKIVLTIAHLNHDVKDNRPENLKALCQKCHLNHDREYHAQQRRKNKLKNQPEFELKQGD